MARGGPVMSDTGAPVTGWQGRFLEDFVVGDVYRHAHGRTITQADNTWFTLLTNNTHDIHYNVDYASRTEFGKPLVVSTLTLAIVTGLSVEDVSRNAVANLGWEHVRCPAPVFAGDTLYAAQQVSLAPAGVRIRQVASATGQAWPAPRRLVGGARAEAAGRCPGRRAALGAAGSAS